MKSKIAILTIIFILNISSGFADKLPPSSQGSVNGIILYTIGNSSKINVFDFQKANASWGHMCSCHIGFSFFTTSGKTQLFYMLGDEKTFSIRFNDGKYIDYESEVQINKNYYSHDKMYDGNTVCHIVNVNKRIKLIRGGNEKDIIYIEPKSVIVFYFSNDYDKNFK